MQIIIRVLWPVNVLACVFCVLLAVAGLFSLAYSRPRQALVLVAPAFAYSILTNVFMGFVWWATTSVQDIDDVQFQSIREVFVSCWIYFVGVPLALSLFTAFLAWYRRRTPGKFPLLAGWFNLAFALTFIAVFSFNALLTFTSPKIYAGTAQIGVTAGSGELYRRDYALAACQVMTSTNVLLSVVAKLDLNKMWGKKFNNDVPFKTWESETILQGRLSYSPVQNTNTIRIEAYSDNPYEAAQIANATIEAWQAYCTQSIGPSFSAKRHPVVTILDSARPILTPCRRHWPLEFFSDAVLGMLAAVGTGGLVILIAGLKVRIAHAAVPKSIRENPEARWESRY